MVRKLIFLSCLGLLAACHSNQHNGNDAQNKNGVKVVTQKVITTKAANDFRYSGTVEPSQTVALMFKGTGTVAEVFVDEGDIVRKGQPLAILHTTNAQHMYDAALASYEQARDAYERLKSVHEKGSLTDIKWVEMETKLKQAESQMLITRSNLNDCTLRAPDDGMIGKRNVEPGQSALSVSAPFELVKIDRILVKVAVPENEISKIRKGMKASFNIAALDDRSFSGVVEKVGIVADKISRTYDVKIMAANVNGEIKPGMVCDVNISLSGEKEVLVVPARAVSIDADGQPYVWLVDSQKNSVRKTLVKTGEYVHAGIEIHLGLSANDMVVVEGKEKLSDNSSIVF
ncbi:MAG: efflux RND transporter periplasmic adaptor subunit [Bacteroidales bacterium]|nr:efflux RND transporter periplasmic adaptor subunit [Bacteroidales bacterium]